VLNVLEDGKATPTAEASLLVPGETEPVAARDSRARENAPAVTASTDGLPTDTSPETSEETLAKPARKSKPAPRDELPRYTTEQLANLLEERADAAAHGEHAIFELC
jgi:hypothetical protein